METRSTNKRSANHDIDDREQGASAPKKLKLTIPRILQGTFFEIVNNCDGRIDAKCTNCSQNSRGLLTSTGNFKSHYKLKHPALLSSLEKYLIGKPDETVKLQQSNLKNFISPAVDIDTVIILFSIDRLYIFTGELII